MLARRIVALSGQGPVTQDQPTPLRRALVCRVAARPQATGVWTPVESPRPTSERDREQFEGQTRAPSFLIVFSCGVGGVGLESWKLAGANFLWRRGFSGTCHRESSEIDDRDHEEPRHNFRGYRWARSSLRAEAHAQKRKSGTHRVRARPSMTLICVYLTSRAPLSAV